MKKILASIVALTAVTGFAGVAHAIPNNHAGNVAVQCTISATDGTLAQQVGNLGVIDSSATPGIITTKCNTTTSKLNTDLTSYTEPAIANPALNAYTVSYKLNAGTRAYNPGSANPGIPTTAYNNYVTNVGAAIEVAGIGFGLIDQPSTVNVVAQGKVNPNAQLVAGDYSILVTATVTP